MENKTTALASFPRSGNTWLRCLIEQMTGQLAGSIYNDRVMPRLDSGIVIKTHEMNGDDYQRAIHLLRNPFDAIHSFYRFQTNIAKESIDWEEHLIKRGQQWVEHTRYWLAYEKDYYLIRYENLRKNTLYELSELHQWLLGCELDEATVYQAMGACSLNNMRRQSDSEIGCLFFGEGQVNKSIDHYNAQQIELLKNVLGDCLEYAGYGD